MTPAEEQELRRKSALLKGLADIRLVTVADGPGIGGRLLEIRSPTGLSLDVALDRGGDILRLAYRGIELGWHSANSAPAPWPTVDIENGLGFLRGFDGFLVTCGLDHHGPATETSAREALYPLRPTHVHPLHGRIMTARAELISKNLDWATGKIDVALVVRQSSVFGEVLELQRHISVEMFQPRVSLVDQVINRGFRPVRHGILYHINIGYPFLDRSARLVGNAWRLRSALDDGSAVPNDSHVEIVDSGSSPDADVDGFSVIGIENPQIHTRLLLQFPPDQLPVTALWRAFQSGVFALGLEPQTDMTCDEPLAAGEERPYELHIELETV